jgi:hypothetical protein
MTRAICGGFHHPFHSRVLPVPDIIISGGDAAEVLKPAKAALDDISATTGRQSGSLSAWIFVVRPPRERPIV